MTKQGVLLVVDDSRSILTAVRLLMKDVFAKVLTTTVPGRIQYLIEEEQVDVVLLDMNFSSGMNSGKEGLHWLSQIQQMKQGVRVVLFTAYADIELAVKGMKEGASDFIVKPWNNEKLKETLQLAYEQKDRTQSLQPTSKGRNSAMCWGESSGMQRLRLLVEKIAPTDANVLITGENGTGKEMLAREIHRHSLRRVGQLVTVDMGSLTESLFESELFGHVKGAFTDAHADRKGKIEEADGGTLFLDEIGNLSFALQAKLLTFLQQRSIVRVGSNKPIPLSVRMITATNRDLHEMVAKSHFREDLLYRMNTIHVEIPPLRDRPEDIPELVALFLDRYGVKYHKTSLSLSADARSLLAEHRWPGNIRELEHAIEKAVIIAEGKQIEKKDLDIHIQKKPLGVPVAEVATIEEMEYQLIKNAIDKHEGNLSFAATQLGISRQTLYNKLKKYGI